MNVNKQVNGAYPNFIKPFFDRLSALVILFFTWPLFLILSIFIKLNSKGPAIFAQRRVGEGNHIFTIYKFRTMVNDHGSKAFTEENDPRITTVGKFLRKTSLDELPQLFNILKGEMSFIGPRPAQDFEKEMYGPLEFERRHVIKPGVTGMHQATFRSNSTLEQKVEMDMYYVDNISPLLDLKILYLTVRLLLKGGQNY